jgi:hypothetical protein
VVDGAENPQFGSILVSIHGIVIGSSPPWDRDVTKPNGRVQWSGECNQDYSADFLATDDGQFGVKHINRSQAGCIIAKDGVENPDVGEQLFAAFGSVVAWAIRDGELWLYFWSTAGDNVLVFQRADGGD